RDTAAVKRIGMVRPRRDCLVVTLPSARKLSVIQVQQTKLFVVSRRRIVEDGALQFLNPAASGEDLKRTPQQAGIWNDFHEDVYERSHPVKQDDPDPEEIRPPPDEVDDGHDPQADRPPRKHEKQE